MVIHTLHSWNEIPWKEGIAIQGRPHNWKCFLSSPYPKLLRRIWKWCSWLPTHHCCCHLIKASPSALRQPVAALASGGSVLPSMLTLTDYSNKNLWKSFTAANNCTYSWSCKWLEVLDSQSMLEDIMEWGSQYLQGLPLSWWKSQNYLENC